MSDLQQLLKDLEKQFPGAVKLASDLKPKEYRSSGSMALDVALGGGYAHGTIVDVVGKESSGKSLLFELAAIVAQREEQKPSCLFDFESTFDLTRFESLGGDTSQLYVVTGQDLNLFIETAMDMMKIQLHHQMFACICLDSTSAMVSKAEYDIKEAKGEEASTMAYTARGLSSMLRQLVGTGLVMRSGATIFFISQLRADIGGRGFKGMPPPDKPTGGKALRFYASNQLEVRRGEIWKGDIQRDSGRVDEDIELGHETVIRVRKNKNNNRQGRVATFDLYTDGEVRGLDQVAELAQLAIATGVIIKAGSWLTLPSGARVQGKDALADTLRADGPLAAEVKKLTLAQLEMAQEVNALPPVVLMPAAEDDADEALMAKLGDE